MNFITDLWNQITGFLADVWNQVKGYIAVILILTAIFFWPPLGLAGFFGVTVTASVGWAIFVGCLVAAFLIDPVASAAFIESIGTALAQVVSTVARAVGSVVGAGLGAFFSSPVGMLIAGLGIWWFLGKDDKDNSDKEVTHV